VANGQFTTISSYTTADIFLAGKGPWNTSLLVVPALIYDVILGTPFLHETKSSLVGWPHLHAILTDPYGDRVTVHVEDQKSPNPAIAAAVYLDPLYSTEETPEKAKLRAFAEAQATFKLFDAGIEAIRPIEVREVVRKFRDRFPDSLPACLPPDRGSRNHKIDIIPGAKLPQLPHYGFCESKLAALNVILTELLEKGIITRHDGDTPACSPGFMVPGAKPRLVGDFRVVNGATVLHAQDVPTTGDFLDRLAMKVYFTLSDMLKGYFQLLIDIQSKLYTTFSTPLGRFYYNVTAMGLKNAGTDFQRAVAACLRTTGLRWDELQNYLDDITVASTTLEEHVLHLEKVLQALREDHWYLSFIKSQFGVRRLHVLGHWVSAGLVFPDATYVTKLSALPSPNAARKKVHALQCFLGLVGYYRRFVPHFATIAAPLTGLLKKGTPWIWEEAQEEAWSKLAHVLEDTVDKGMALFNPTRQTRISTDASGCGLGAILEQETADDQWVPVAFFSKALTSAEAALVNYERELLAIFCACRKWLGYLQGVTFQIRCDCNALRNISGMSLEGRKRRVTTMLLFLCTLSFRWTHIKGTENVFADALSRLVPDTNDAPVHDDLLRVLPGDPADPSASQLRLPIQEEIEECWDELCALQLMEAHDPDRVDFSPIEAAWCAALAEAEGPVNPPKACWPLPVCRKAANLQSDLRLSSEDALPWDDWTIVASFMAVAPDADDSRDADCGSSHPFDWKVIYDDPNDMFAPPVASLCPVDGHTGPVDGHPGLVADPSGPALGPHGPLPGPTGPSGGPSGPVDGAAMPGVSIPSATPVMPPPPSVAPAPARIGIPAGWDYAADPKWKVWWDATAGGPAGNFHRDQSNSLLLCRNQIVVPSAMVPMILADCHVNFGHMAVSTLTRMITDWGLWWPTQNADCASFVKNCATCALKALHGGRIYGLLGERPTLGKCQEIAIDFTGLPKTALFDGVLGVIDRFSRFVVWIPGPRDQLDHATIFARSLGIGAMFLVSRC
jgi:hypothetical protein